MARRNMAVAQHSQPGARRRNTGLPGAKGWPISGMSHDSFTCGRCETAARAERALAGSVGDPTRPEGYTATLSLIPSFGAFTRSCLVPR